MLRASWLVVSESVDCLNESVNRFCFCSPACAEAHGTVFRIDCCPLREKELSRQRGDLFSVENGELLVGGAFHKHGYAFGGKSLFDAHGLLNGVTRYAHIQVVAKQFKKLYAQQSAFGKHAALLLDVVAEMLVAVGWVGEHHRLAEKCSHLGAANVEHVAQRGELLQADVAGIGSKSLAQSCPVDE